MVVRPEIPSNEGPAYPIVLQLDRQEDAVALGAETELRRRLFEDIPTDENWRLWRLSVERLAQVVSHAEEARRLRRGL